MLFSSYQFLLFFPFVAALFFLVPQRGRWALLLVASYFFYMCWRPEYVVLIAGITLVNYGAGRLVASRSGLARRVVLAGSLVASLGLLVVFKYADFLLGSVNAVLEAAGSGGRFSALGLLLPVGISFYTFQALSYTIDVYRGHRDPERHLGYFALYVSFFPQLVAGPIERSTRLLPQLRATQTFDGDRVRRGLTLVGWGLFQKMVVADRLALVVDEVYRNPGAWSGLSLAIATLFFSIQIYCDFAGYSNIAIGSARVMGFDLMTNFKTPYLADNVRDFWRRWHISLSTWFRDYLYFPLGGSRTTRVRLYRNIFIVFLVSGLWHGANWTFLAWGAFHGLWMGVSTWRSGRGRGAPTSAGEVPPALRVLKTAFTFTLVTLAWIPFRASSLGDAGTIYARIFGADPAGARTLDFQAFNLWSGFVLVGVLLLSDLALSRPTRVARLVSLPAPLRWAGVACGLVAFVFLADFSGVSFIYFQF